MAFLSLTFLFFSLTLLLASTFLLNQSSAITGFDLPVILQQRNPNKIKYNGYDAIVGSDNVGYYMYLKLGSPPQDYLLHVDTSSIVTWVECNPCYPCLIDNKYKNRRFDPSRSNTYLRLGCNNSACNGQFECSKDGYCVYEISYLDQGFTVGEVGMDLLYVQPKFYDSQNYVTIPNFTFGCGKENHIATYQQQTYHGIAGLAMHQQSFVSQLGVKRFSHCFPSIDTPKIQTTLRFGTNAQYYSNRTVPIPNSPFTHLYLVQLFGISVGVKRLQISSDFFFATKLGGLAMIDSGTYITNLHKLALQPLIAELFQQIHTTSRPYTDMNGRWCFPSNGTVESLPQITFHLYEFDFTISNKGAYQSGDKLFCANFRTEEDRNIIGITAQIDVAIGYDVAQRRISFQPTNCMKALDHGR